jgi:hypothetical protein
MTVDWVKGPHKEWKMKKKIANDSLVTALARGVGHAAGVIVKATQGLATNAVALKTESVPEKLAQTSKRRSIRKESKKSTRKAMALTRRSRKRSGTLASTGKRKKNK